MGNSTSVMESLMMRIRDFNDNTKNMTELTEILEKSYRFGIIEMAHKIGAISSKEVLSFLKEEFEEMGIDTSKSIKEIVPVKEQESLPRQMSVSRQTNR